LVKAGRGGVAVVLVALATASSAGALSVQSGGIRVSVFAQLKPYKLPRTETAPIAVSIAGHLEPTGGGIPPQLQEITIGVNRHGLLQSRGLPSCPAHRLLAATSEKALELCKGALIGSGRFWAHIVLPEQGSYPTRGELLIFNSERQGSPIILAHIYTSDPFDSAFTIAFSLRHLSKGPFGTELHASLPEALGEWGYLDRIKLNLKREYPYKGQTLSYFNASCPAPKGTSRLPFRLARATLTFAAMSLTASIDKSCGVKR
jgi:hypothetical protein